MRNALSGKVYCRPGLALLVLALAVSLRPAAQAAVIYESATLGPTGVTGPYSTVLYSQWFGVRFQVIEPVLATKIGGHFVAGIPGSAAPARTFFGAVVALTGPDDMPDTAPVFVIDIDEIKYYEWTGTDILAKVSIVAPNTSDDIRADLPAGGILLEPGYYALIFGALASNSRVGLVTNGTDIGTVSGFSWISWSELNPGSPFPDDWYDGYRQAGTRFVVEGAVAPSAQFLGTPTLGAAPLTVNFTDQSTGTVDSWDWSFGDGLSSNEQNPSHTYNDPGSYTVTLTVTGSDGSDTETKTDYIKVSYAATAMPWIPLLLLGN